MQNIKSQLYHQLLELIDQKIDLINQSIKSVEDSRNNETKSTAGDKHETSRALMQSELERQQSSLAKALEQKRQLAQIDIDSKNQKIALGSLVTTSKSNYFISIAYGKLTIDNKNYYCISLASPIGKLLFNQSEGDQISFRNQAFTIASIH